MQKYLMVILITAAAIFGIVAMIAQTPKSNEELAKEQKNQLRISATNFQFDKPEYHVKQGSKLTVVLVNKEGIHGLGIPDLNVNLQGDKLQQEVTFDKPGTFDMHCIVMCGAGHANMKSKLVVDPS
ncbi:cytochrome C oxidase subunit II [Ferviditalea candida]|uniref:Cytochrome C oxidase subunit II n=1 Tax=Ferviditalea candida TaxID=3108399 RepID=A0ABU5ZKI8_9BACL|nr:cytochrome C oxidase subunit II [Paenibacillaceae bacterium T2]